MFEFTQLTTAADCPFRKQAHDFAGAQQFVDLLQCLFALARRNRNDAEEVKEPLQIPALVDGLVHHKTHRPRAGDLNHRPVEPTDVITQHQNAAATRQVFKSQHLNTVGAGEHPCNNITYQRLWQLIDGIEGTCQGNDGQYMKQADTADTVDGKEHSQAQESQHDDVLHPVVACQHGAQLVITGMELYQCIEWHNKHAATDTQQ